MKKFFTLLMASASVVCANAASDLSFSVTTQDKQITVTPSNDTDSYFAVALDEYAMNVWAMYGASTDNPDMLFLLATSVYDQNVFTGAWSYDTDVDGQYVVMAVAAHMDDAGIVADGDYYIETVTIGGGNDEPGTGDEPSQGEVTLNFTLESDGQNFTLTPSDLDQPYYLWVFSQEEADLYQSEMGLSLVDAFGMFAADVWSEDILTGVTTQSGASDWWLEEYGTYYIVAAPMQKDDRYYNICGNVTVLEWDYNDGTATAINTVALNANKQAKAMIDGRIVLNGRYGLNGMLVK